MKMNISVINILSQKIKVFIQVVKEIRRCR